MRACRRRVVAGAGVSALLALPTVGSGQAPELLTPGEENGWESLSTHAEVVDFYRQLQARSPYVRTFRLGWSRERRELLTVAVANPAVTTPAEAHAAGKPIVFIGAQVHGNEPAGKEGLMLFARDVALGRLQTLLDDVVFVFVPQINPDAAEAGEVGTRPNPSGYNLNRDYVRLDNPETRALVSQGLAYWEPHVLVDAHEAFGPPRYYDFYTSYPRSGHVPTPILELTEEEVLPAVVGALNEAGFSHYFYHTVPADIVDNPSRPITKGGGGARSLSSYGGPHGAITFLFESLRPRDPRPGIERRAVSQRVAMEGLSRYVAANSAKVLGTIAAGRAETIARGSRWDAADSVFVRWESYVTGRAPYRVWSNGEVVEREVPIRDGRRPTMGRIRPVGYVIEAHREDVAEHLALHGITVERVLEPVSVSVESFHVDSVARALEPYEGHIPREFSATLEPQVIEVPAGTWIVRADQKRAGLLFHMMEPEDNESLASIGWFPNHEGRGDLLPIHRIRNMPQVPMQVRSGSAAGFAAGRPGRRTP